MSEHLPIFVFGTLRQGMRNHHYLAGVPFVPATIAGSLLELGGGFPLCCIERAEDRSRRIVGELYSVPDADFAAVVRRLDALEGEGYFYHRKIVEVFTAKGPQRGYVYVNTVGRIAGYRVIESGDWCAFVAQEWHARSA